MANGITNAKVEAAIEAAVAAEREACAVRIKQAADQLDAAAARIGELVAERDMAQAMIDELNGDLALVARERNEARAVLVTARAEAALAEREALLREIEDGVSSHSRGADASTRAFVDGFVARELERLRDRIRARTTPDTLSTDTLAAIAEARGLCVVEPEHIAELQAAAKTLSEMPVLLWTRDGSKDTATVAGLTLLASNLDWRVEVTKTGKLIDAGVIMADGIVAARICAARCASEVLGVTLPAEDNAARDGDGGVL
jgi:hypothetical protein